MLKSMNVLLIVSLTFFIAACGNTDSDSINHKATSSSSAESSNHGATDTDSGDTDNDKGHNEDTPGSNDAEDKTDHENKAQHEDGLQQAKNSEEYLSQSEVLNAVKKQIDTDLTINLPKQLPLKDSEHLTAATDSSADQYSVIFFASDKPISINNKKLNDASQARKIIHLKVKDLKDQEKADQEISFEDFSKNGAEEVDLGHDITGYQDAGVGNLWTGWNEGRWALASHTHTDQGEKGVELARDTVEYLEENELPIPDKNGYIRLDATDDGHSILWEKGTIVYTLDQFEDPNTGLQTATSMD